MFVAVVVGARALLVSVQTMMSSRVMAGSIALVGGQAFNFLDNGI